MNPITRCNVVSGIVLFLLAVVVFITPSSVFAAEIPRQDKDILLDTYHRNVARLAANSFGLPLFLESVEKDDRVHVDVYGILNHPFSRVSSELRDPANWCDVVFLSPNVKACTSREMPPVWMLTFYLGRKVYQSPEEARRITYRFRNIEHQQGYLDDVLIADDGPYGTKDHRLRFEAIPLDGGRTFVHVSYAYSDSVALRLAAKIYYATFARDKVGFTVTGKDGNGQPVYIGGPRGSLERNAVRYYFAIQSYMDSLRFTEESRFSMRLNEWYDVTTRYRRQLFDLDKKDYLMYKTAEHKNQVKLQLRIGTGRK